MADVETPSTGAAAPPFPGLPHAQPPPRCTPSCLSHNCRHRPTTNQASPSETWNPILLLRKAWRLVKHFVLDIVRRPQEIKRVRMQNLLLRVRAKSLREKLDFTRKQCLRRERWVAEMIQNAALMMADNAKLLEAFSREDPNATVKLSELSPQTVMQKNRIRREEKLVDDLRTELLQKDEETAKLTALCRSLLARVGGNGGELNDLLCAIESRRKTMQGNVFSAIDYGNAG